MDFIHSGIFRATFNKSKILESLLIKSYEET